MASTARKSIARKSTAKATVRTDFAKPAAPASAVQPVDTAQAAALVSHAQPRATRRVKTVAAPPVRKSAATANSASKAGLPKPATASRTATDVKAPKAGKTVKLDKARKAKLVRDSFTIPKAEYLVLEQLKQRAMQLGAPIKKSELLRAGIKALAAMDSVDYLACLAAVPVIKTGRPATS